MSTSQREPTEEEMRAYEAEIKRIAVVDVTIQTAVSLINLGGRRLGLSPGAEDERNLEQVRDAIDAVRGLMPVLERRAARELGPLRDALAQLQMAYAREAQAAAPADSPQGAGQPGSAGPGGAEPGGGQPGGGQPGSAEPGGGQPGGGQPAPDKGGAGPAQSSGRLWVPGR
jgi:hypothetical protein